MRGLSTTIKSTHKATFLSAVPASQTTSRVKLSKREGIEWIISVSAHLTERVGGTAASEIAIIEILSEHIFEEVGLEEIIVVTSQVLDVIILGTV